ncbi:hypothetical protein Tco_1575799 [Tanacetum coccineum]
MQRLEEHEKNLSALTQINHAEAIEDSIKANMPKFVPQAAFEFVQPRLERTDLDVIKKNPINLLQSTSTPSAEPTKYELKHQLYEKMFETAVYLYHEKHHALYDALQDLMQVNKLEARYKSTKTSTKKRSHDDLDPPKNHEGEKKMKRRKVVGGSSSKKDKEPGEHELQLGSTVMFGKCMKKFLNKNKITKPDLEGLTFELLKNRIDWTNPEGERFHNDLSKTLLLTGFPSRKTIPTSVKRITVEKKHGYEYLKEIVVKREDKKEYIFVEADFPRLNQNDIEDMYLLKIQDTIHHMDGIAEFDLINAL